MTARDIADDFNDDALAHGAAWFAALAELAPG